MHIGSIPIFKVLPLVHTEKTLTWSIVPPLFFKAQTILNFCCIVTPSLLIVSSSTWIYYWPLPWPSWSATELSHLQGGCYLSLAHTGYKRLSRLAEHVKIRLSRKSKFGVCLMFQKNMILVFEKKQIESLIVRVARVHTACLKLINLPNLFISLCHDFKYLI